MRIFLLLLAIVAINIPAQDAATYPYYYKSHITSTPAPSAPINEIIFSSSPMSESELNTALGFSVTNYQLNGNTVTFDNQSFNVGSQGFAGNTFILSISLNAGIIDVAAFDGCTNIQTINYYKATEIRNGAHYDNLSLTTINIAKCISLGNDVDYTSVFANCVGNTITLTIPAALMTCNGGNPDGDIQYLQANNTITIIQIP